MSCMYILLPYICCGGSWSIFLKKKIFSDDRGMSIMIMRRARTNEWLYERGNSDLALEVEPWAQDLHCAFILLLTSSVTLKNIFNQYHWMTFFFFLTASVEMELKMLSLQDKWESEEKYMRKCLRIKSGSGCKEIGGISPSRKHEKKREKVSINIK